MTHAPVVQSEPIRQSPARRAHLRTTPVHTRGSGRGGQDLERSKGVATDKARVRKVRGSPFGRVWTRSSAQRVSWHEPVSNRSRSSQVLGLPGSYLRLAYARLWQLRRRLQPRYPDDECAHGERQSGHIRVSCAWRQAHRATDGRINSSCRKGLGLLQGIAQFLPRRRPTAATRRAAIHGSGNDTLRRRCGTKRFRTTNWRRTGNKCR